MLSRSQMQNRMELLGRNVSCKEAAETFYVSGRAAISGFKVQIHELNENSYFRHTGHTETSSFYIEKQAHATDRAVPKAI